MKRIRQPMSLQGRVEIFHSEGEPVLRNGPPVPPLIPASILKLLKPGQYVPTYRSCDIDFSGCKIVGKQDIRNKIVGIGKDKVIEALTTGFINQIARMAVGDRGTIPSDPTQPKVVDPIQEDLFGEVFRSDVDSTVLDVGVTPGVHEVKFIKTFSATVIPLTAFSNQANPVVNEVGLIMADLIGGAPLPRPDVAAPNAPDADESLFAMRTFKSVPFEAANEISVTIRYTIFIE